VRFVIEEVQVIDENWRSAVAAGFAKHVLDISWKVVEQRKLLTSNHCESAFCWIYLSGSTYQVSIRPGPATFSPLK